MEEMAKRKYEIAYNLMWPNRIVMRIEDRCLGGNDFNPDAACIILFFFHFFPCASTNRLTR